MRDMLGREDITTVEAALALLLDALPSRLPAETPVPISQALGMVCSQDILSPEDLPAFARSTVDGYAVRAESTFGARETMPAYLNISGEVFMGRAAGFLLPAGAVAKIPTGGMLPDGADAVIMFEHVQAADGSMIEVLRAVAPGENVIQAGEDAKRGEVVIRRGSRMRPQHIGALAGTGITEVPVFERPVAGIISTGDEIIPAAGRPEPGKVRDINSYVLAGMTEEAGGIPLKKGIISDEYGQLRPVIEEAMRQAGVILISGGTSVGTKDMVARVIQDIGHPGVLFHGVALKPGKPMIGGVIDGIPVFGLPGHPAAVCVCFEVFVRPVLDWLAGLRDVPAGSLRGTVRARLARNVASVSGREEHVRVALEKREDGLWAVPILGKSGLITTLVKADGTIVIPLHANGIEQGEMVEVRLF